MTELRGLDRGVPILAAAPDGISSDTISTNKMVSGSSVILARYRLGRGQCGYGDKGQHGSHAAKPVHLKVAHKRLGIYQGGGVEALDTQLGSILENVPNSQ